MYIGYSLHVFYYYVYLRNQTARLKKTNEYKDFNFIN